MRHVYECPMRWADLDLLGHVNNVTYVDYLQEARVDMLRVHPGETQPDHLAEAVVVVRHEIDYLAPLGFRFGSVRVESWVSEIRAATFTLGYELTSERDGQRTVHARATTVLAPFVFGAERPRRITAEERASLARFHEPAERPRRTPPSPRPAGAEHVGVPIRFSDLDIYGHVNNVRYVEYLQEARIGFLAGLTRDLDEPARSLRLVVARTEVDYRRPILYRPEPYDLWSWICDVGRTSFVIESEILDGDTVLARGRVVGVSWDPATGRAVVPPPQYRERLLAATGTGTGPA